MLSQQDQQKAARKFADNWKDKGDEKQETQRFWIQLLQNVLGVADGASYIEFEKRVKLSHTSFIDAYIASTKVLIEQKGIKIDLHKAYEQSDGAVLTPFELEKRETKANTQGKNAGSARSRILPIVAGRLLPPIREKAKTSAEKRKSRCEQAFWLENSMTLLSKNT